MIVRFWGTRGSIPRPGATTLRYGGNTSCVEVQTADGRLIVLDCGTGGFPLGQALLASGRRPLRGHLLFTHTHWDHIQGFPMFTPLFIPGNEWDLYAPQGLGKHLEETLAGQMEYTNWPLSLDELPATIRFHELLEGTFELDGVRITAQYLNHPVLTLGYRLEVGGAVLVYATDHEPHARRLPGAAGDSAGGSGGLLAHREDRRHVEWLADADLVIHDTMYTAAEYPQKIGWGHTAAEHAVDFAVAARVKRLALFHHDPVRDDDALERIVETCRQRALSSDSTLDVFAAAEGSMVELRERKGRLAHASGRGTAVEEQNPLVETVPGTEMQKVLIVDDEPETVRLLTRILQKEGLGLLTAYDGESALRVARREQPDLILLDWRMPGGLDGLAVCRILRAEENARLRDVQVVLLTAMTGEEETAEGFAAGVTDYLTKPFTPAYVRSRVQAWLLRSRTMHLVDDGNGHAP